MPKKNKTVKIEELIRDPKNARIHSKENTEAIAKSLKRFGAGRSIFVDADNIVRAGNGTLEAAKQAGFKEVRIVEAEPGQLIAVKRSDMRGAEAEGYAIADNRSAELATWDEKILHDTICDLTEFGDQELLDSLGFSDGEINRIAQFNIDPNDPNAEWAGMPDFENNDKKAYRDMVVHFHTKESFEAFVKFTGQTVTERTRYMHIPAVENINLSGYGCDDEE